MTQPTELERDALEAIFKQVPGLRDQVPGQVDTLTVVDRDNSGAGLIVSFEPVQTVSNPDLNGFFGNVLLDVEGIPNGFGAMVYFENGRIDMLEFYSFGDSTVEIDFNSVAYKVVDSH